MLCPGCVFWDSVPSILCQQLKAAPLYLVLHLSSSRVLEVSLPHTDGRFAANT